jgi:hypothetical protein
MQKKKRDQTEEVVLCEKKDGLEREAAMVATDKLGSVWISNVDGVRWLFDFLLPHLGLTPMDGCPVDDGGGVHV